LASNMSESVPVLEVLPRDLSAYAQGNIGIPYVHRFESGRPGPHVLINALTHGNEICGMVAATHLLDNGVRPLIGTLTVSFAHVEAYNAFDPSRPFANRQIEHNLNRIWSDELLGGSEHSPELRRARELRPVVAAADHILDIHSTSQDNEPFWVYPGFERNARVALAVGLPAVHLVMPSGLGSGTPLIQHGAHAGEMAPGAALVAECGQHFRRSSALVATEVTLRLLSHFGLIEHTPSALPAAPRRFELLRTCMVTTPQFRFVRPLVGFETFDAGELIATDGQTRIEAPCDRCTVFMPTREPIVGREAVYLTRPLA